MQSQHMQTAIPGYNNTIAICKNTQNGTGKKEGEILQNSVSQNYLKKHSGEKCGLLLKLIASEISCLFASQHNPKFTMHI